MIGSEVVYYEKLSDPSVLQGACVQSLEATRSIKEGLPPICPIICHFINGDATVTYLTDREWARMEKGTRISGSREPKNNLDKFAQDVWKDIEIKRSLYKGPEQEKSWEENTRRTSYDDYQFRDNFMYDDFKTPEDEKAFNEATFRSSNFQWFQPKYATTYIGLHRFGAGDRVQTWSVIDGKASKTGGEVILNSATRILSAFTVSTFILML